MTPPPLLGTLTEINLDDLFEAAGLASLRRSPLRPLLRPVARRFAHVAHEFDRRVGAHGLAAGSAWMVQRMSGGLRPSGLQHLPAEGPLLVVANHPGMTDTVALIASLSARPDLRVIALDRPFLRALPHTARRLILMPDGEAGRLAVVRAGVRHLQQGGAVLTFPAGRIEPDPAAFGAAPAQAALRQWSDGFALFARRVPATRCVPALVSGVIAPASLRHPLTWLRRTSHDREKLAAALQVALPYYQTHVARVAFGPALPAEGPDALHAAALATMHELIEADHAAAATPPIAAPAGRPAIQRLLRR